MHEWLHVVWHAILIFSFTASALWRGGELEGARGAGRSYDRHDHRRGSGGVEEHAWCDEDEDEGSSPGEGRGRRKGSGREVELRCVALEGDEEQGVREGQRAPGRRAKGEPLLGGEAGALC